MNKYFTSLSLFLSIALFSNAQCPTSLTGFSLMGEYNEHHYFISDNNAQPADAQLVAEQNGGYLTVINDQAENDFLQQHISEMVYIGLNDVQTEGNLKWVNGEPLTYNNIDPCSFCEENSASLDYVIIAPWNGSWSFSSQWNPRKYIVEIPCGTEEPILDISYDCPNTFPNDGNDWVIPITVTNNSTLPSMPQTAYLFLEWENNNGPSPVNYGEISIPSLVPGASFSGDIIAPNSNLILPNIIYSSPIDNPSVTGDYFLTFDETGNEKPMIVDFYCKKTTTNISVEIISHDETYDDSGVLNYTVQISNTGQEAAHNTLAVVGEQVTDNFSNNLTPNTITLNGLTENFDYLRLGGRNIFWFVGLLQSGESKSVDITLNLLASETMFDILPDKYFITAAVATSQGRNEIFFGNDFAQKESTKMTTGEDCTESIAGLTYLGEREGHKYFISNTHSKPADAQLVAQQNGGYLVSINDQAENDFLQQHISEMVYIGLNDVQTEGNLEWLNGDALNYNNINPCGFCSENSDELDYVIIAPWDGSWSFSSQWNERKYIVEIPCDDTTIGTLTFDCPDDKTIFTNPSTGLALIDFNDVSVFSTCPLGGTGGGVNIINIGDVESGEVGVGTYQISFEATDACGNIDNCSYTITVAEVDCQTEIEGFTALGNFGNSEYFLSNESDQPQFAQMTAELNGGYLAVINDQAENDFLQQYIDGMVFIGLNDAQTEGSLEWVNGAAVNFSNFDICSFCDENTDGNDYVMMHSWDGTWSWNNLWNRRKYIVEVPCDTTEPCICTTEYDPVCGSDGVTYSNACEADCAGVSYMLGACEPPITECPKGIGWDLQTPLFTTDNLEDVQFVDDLNGWAAGGRGTVIKSNDGGQTWDVLSVPTDRNLNDVEFINTQLGWVVGYAIILKTEDGGHSWTPQNELDENVNWRAIEFIDENNGWVSGDNKIMQTTDGGESWVEQDSGIEGYNSWRDIQFVDSSNGWAVSDQGYIIHTSDGGQTWTEQFYNSNFYFHAVHFIDDQIGWAANARGILRTINGGQNWIVQYGVANLIHTDVYFVDANNGWAFTRGAFVGMQGQIFSSTDGGITWNSVSFSTDSRFQGGWFADTGHGWAVGNNGLILKTTNGSTWENISGTINAGLLRDVFFINENEGWAVGGTGINIESIQGNIIHTTDGGENWEFQNATVDSRLTSLSFINETEGWAAGIDGTILHTENGGENWMLQNSGTDELLKDVFFVDHQNGWAMGEDFILRTSNGGTSWMPLNVGNEVRSFFKLFFVNENVGYTIGYDQGYVDVLLKTTDGGTNWQPFSLGGVSSRSLFFINENEGWIVGAGGVILHTTDGGLSFEDQSFPTLDSYVDVYFLNDMIGWILTGRSVFKTIDGGENWVEQNIGTNTFLYNYALHFANEENGWVVGNNGTVIKYGEVEPEFKDLDYVGEFGGNEYYLSTVESNWELAQSSAEVNGGYLAVINDQAENDFIQQNISEIVHIGLTDVILEGDLKWVNGEAFSFSNFDDCDFCVQNSDDFDHVIMQQWNGKWSFGSRNSLRKYVVEIPCGDVAQFNSIPNNSIAISEQRNNKEFSIKNIYPNPAMDQIFAKIESPDERIVEVQIFDARGVLVKTKKVNLLEGENTIEVSVKELLDGFYFIKTAQKEGKGVVKRFVKMTQ